jgi:hypothetical protein
LNQINVFKGRTKVVQVALGYDVSNDTITSEIRVDKNHTSELLATWEVKFATDGKDGELILTLYGAITSAITKFKGYMDLKRVSGGEPISVFDEPLEVLFHETVTA